MSNSSNFDEKELFQSLVESAFEFLNKALDEFEGSPKFSTVHFAVAIELFLKARLMKEHWSLIVEKTDTANRSSFFAGQLKTVNPDTAIKRLKDIACDPIPEDAKNIFKTIAQHRNRMVHFVHESAKPPKQKQSELEEIVAEQCKGWRQLQLLLERNWKIHFEGFSGEIEAIDGKMQRHRGYLEAKFHSKSDEIKSYISKGNSVHDCPSCGFASVLTTPIDGAISSANCLVCWFSGSFVSIDCPEEKCHQLIEFSSYDGPMEHCPSCGATISAWISEGLNTGDTITSDNYIDHVEKNCPYCSGYHSVVEHHDGYVCTECFEYSDVFETCDWCQEGQLGGVSGLSYVDGCCACDGRVGWDKD